ncbi:hypothetical protein C8Q80DRAFT_1145692 [Daedaleopsis nitida]|nr:hypothetical protein C8Q80DRAFT_1145692 [Daedaleopsis nitida]
MALAINPRVITVIVCVSLMCSAIVVCYKLFEDSQRVEEKLNACLERTSATYKTAKLDLVSPPVLIRPLRRRWGRCESVVPLSELNQPLGRPV